MVDFKFFQAEHQSAAPLYAQLADMLRSENKGLAAGFLEGGKGYAAGEEAKLRAETARELVRMRMKAEGEEIEQARAGQEAVAKLFKQQFGIEVPYDVDPATFRMTAEAAVRLTAQEREMGTVVNQQQARSDAIQRVRQKIARLADPDERRGYEVALEELEANAALMSPTAFGNALTQISNDVAGVVYSNDGSVEYVKREVIPGATNLQFSGPNAALINRDGTLVDVTAGGQAPPRSTPTMPPPPPAPEPEPAADGEAKPKASGEAKKPAGEASDPARGAPWAEASDEDRRAIIARLRVTNWSDKEALWGAFGGVDPDTVPPEVIEALIGEIKAAQTKRLMQAPGREKRARVMDRKFVDDQG